MVPQTGENAVYLATSNGQLAALRVLVVEGKADANLADKASLLAHRKRADMLRRPVTRRCCVLLTRDTCIVCASWFWKPR